MIIDMIKKVVLRKDNGEYVLKGTCFFVDSNIAITARHVVKDKENVYIEMSKELYIKVDYKCHSMYDFAILKTSEPVYQKDFYELNGTMVFEGEKWKSFGFPTTREFNGVKLSGIVSISETIEESLYDIDVKMIPDGALSDYRGMSGAPVIINNTVQAILITKYDGISLGGVKIDKCLDFLKENGVKFKSNYSEWVEKINSKQNVSSKISIERKGLKNELEKFILEESGLVVGKAGTGKSYMLNILQNHLNEKGIPCIYLAIDEFDNVSDLEFRKELSLDGDEGFTDKLTKEIKRLRLKDKKLIIIFDSYDSARNEKVKDRFMKIIIRIKKELKDYCNVIVSSRIYDAEISPKLQEIFPYKDIGKGKSINKIQCRHMIIGELDEKEVIESLSQIGIDATMYEKCTFNFKQLLKVPFNLWLIENTFKNSIDMIELQSINSETELLEMFWDKKLNGTKKDSLEAILRTITERMVKQKTLTIRKSDFFISNMQSEWNILLSESILKYVDAFEKKIAFSHNILFDYAVNKVLLTDKIDEFIKFIEEDTSRVIFLRPSLMYFFNSIWYYENSYFWNIIFEITDSNKIPVISKFLPIHTIIAEIKDINDLDVLIDKWNYKDSDAEEIVKRLLQALDIFNVLDNKIWIEFIEKISLEVKPEFIGVLSYNIHKVVDISLARNDNGNLNICGEIARKFYLWILYNNNISNDWYREVTSKFLLPTICKTYFTDVSLSKEIIKDIIDNIDADGTNIDFVSSISKFIINIYKNDVGFTKYLFSRVYSQKITSSEATNIGSSTVLRFLSNKKQDYEMCKYNFQTEINSLINIDSKNGIKIALRTLNSIIDKNHRLTRQNSIVISFNNINITIFEDNSHWWASNYVDDGIYEYSKAIFDYLNAIALKDNEVLLDEFFDIFNYEAKSAYIWGQLFLNASKNIDIFKDRLFDLCVSHEVMNSNDLVYQLGVFIKFLSSEVSREQLIKIEQAINSLGDTGEANNRKKRLISCIDKDLLYLNESIEIINGIEVEAGKDYNTPLVKFTVTEVNENYEEELKRKRISINSKKEILVILQQLHDLNKKVLNRRATIAEVNDIYENSVRLYQLMKGIKLESELEKEVWRELSRGMYNSATGEVKHNLKNNYKIYKEIFVKISNLNVFDEKDSGFRGLYQGYNQTPKHLAAELLPVLIAYQDDQSIMNAIEILLNHSSVSLRCILIKNLYRIYDHEEIYLWEKLNNIILEDNEYIISSAVDCLSNLVNVNNEKVCEILKIGCGNNENNTMVIDNSVELILYFHFFINQEWTKEIVNNMIQYMHSYSWIGPNGILAVIFEWIKYDRLENVNDSTITDIITFINNVVCNLQDEIKTLNEKLVHNSNDKILTEQLKKSYEIFDSILDNIYFKCGAFRDDNNERNKKLEQNYYFIVKPIIKKVVKWIAIEKNSLVLAPTIHRVIEMLNYCLEYDVCDIIGFIEAFISYSTKVGYVSDSLATKQMVDIIKKTFADHKLEIQKEDVLKNILSILDCFAEIGNGDAVNFIWRLEEIYR